MSKARYTLEIELDLVGHQQAPTCDALVKKINEELEESRLRTSIPPITVLGARDRLTPEALALVEELDALCEKHDVAFDQLDELVHDAKNSEGSDINGSHEDQLKYLVVGYADLKQAREKLLEIIRSDAQEGMVECCSCGLNEFAEKAHLDRDKKPHCEGCWDPRLK